MILHRRGFRERLVCRIAAIAQGLYDTLWRIILFDLRPNLGEGRKRCDGGPASSFVSETPLPETPSMEQPIILCGLGRVGWRVLEYLQAAGFPTCVVDVNCPAQDPRLKQARPRPRPIRHIDN